MWVYQSVRHQVYIRPNSKLEPPNDPCEPRPLEPKPSPNHLNWLQMQPLPRNIIILGFTAFFLIGLEQSLFGPAFVALNGHYNLESGTVGTVVTAHFLGVTLGTLLSVLVLTRLRVRGLTLLSSALCALGLLLVGTAPSWTVALGGAFLAGLGFGSISGGYGTLFSSRGLNSRGQGGSAALSLLNAFWGVGSIVGPLLANGVLERGLNLYFGSAALLFAGLALATLLLRFPEVALGTETSASTRAPSFAPLIPFMLMLCCYSGLEVASSSWMVTHLRVHLALEAANTVNSLFWVMLTAGRFLTAPLSLRFSPGQLVLGSSALVVLCTIFTAQTGAAPYAYAALGLSMAPIFPMSLAWFASRFPRLVGYTPLVIGSASLGASLFPALTGLGVSALGLSSVPWSLGLFAVLLLGLAGVNSRSSSARGLSV